MQFKKWLLTDGWDGVSGVGALPSGVEPPTGGEYASAGLSSGGGQGGGAFDNWGNKLQLKQHKKKLKMGLGYLGSKITGDPRPRPNQYVVDKSGSMNSGGSGSFA